jgi:hypothetical protein
MTASGSRLPSWLPLAAIGLAALALIVYLVLGLLGKW